MYEINHFRFWNENLKKRGSWCAGDVHAMLSIKTFSYDSHLQRLESFW